MNTIKIYTLAYTNSHSTDDVDHFFTYKDCFDAMVEKIEISERVRLDKNEINKAFDNGEFIQDGIVIGKYYAHTQGFAQCWEIFERIVNIEDINKSIIVSKFFSMYPHCWVYESLVFDFLNEYSAEKIAEAASSDENTCVFINDCIVGECLYQRAAAELGGKTDEKSTATIFEFFNDYKFLPFFNNCFEMNGFVWQEDNDPYAHENWVYAMLTICDANEDVVKEARTFIDKTYKTNIFAESILEKYSPMLCENHREKSSHLSDEEYLGFVEAICERTNNSSREKTTYVDSLVCLWNEMVEKFLEIARQEGFDYIERMMIGNYEFRHSNATDKWIFSIECSYDELAYFIDTYYRYKSEGKRFE